jgi:hypothetical protein
VVATSSGFWNVVTRSFVYLLAGFGAGRQFSTPFPEHQDRLKAKPLNRQSEIVTGRNESTEIQTFDYFMCYIITKKNGNNGNSN